MKVLLVNKFNYIKGGSETYLFELKELLEANEHEVAIFSMKNEGNLESKYEDYFVDKIDYNDKSLKSKIRGCINIIYSLEAKEKISKMIDDFEPDIVHLHLFQHQMSPSIIKPIRNRNIPIVYTAHDLKMVCPNYKMMTNGEICEKCRDKKYINCIKNRCLKKSYIKSCICYLEFKLHDMLGSYDYIDRIITPSNFYRNKFIEFGINERRLTHIPNFLNQSKYICSEECEDYILYYGRLSEEKGIKTLIKAVKGTEIKLKIVGTGPLEKEIKQYIEENNLEKNIEILGFKRDKELQNIIKKCIAVVVPSEWYENGPYTIIEALAFGKPVIGSDIGGIPEHIRDNETGYIFRYKSSDELRMKILNLYNDKNNQIRMGINSRRLFEEKFTSDIHYKSIMSVYRSLCK